MLNALALLSSVYMVLELQLPFFLRFISLSIPEGHRSPSDDQTLLFTSEEKRVIEDQ